MKGIIVKIIWTRVRRRVRGAEVRGISSDVRGISLEVRAVIEELEEVTEISTEGVLGGGGGWEFRGWGRLKGVTLTDSQFRLSGIRLYISSFVHIIIEHHNPPPLPPKLSHLSTGGI